MAVVTITFYVSKLIYSLLKQPHGNLSLSDIGTEHIDVVRGNDNVPLSGPYLIPAYRHPGKSLRIYDHRPPDIVTLIRIDVTHPKNHISQLD